jgi:hypothetical protein
MTCQKIHQFTENNTYKPLLQQPLWYCPCVEGGQHYHFKMNNTSKRLSFLLGSRSLGVSINKLNCGLLAFLSWFTQAPGWWLKLGNNRVISTHSAIRYSVIMLTFVVTWPKVSQSSLNKTRINIIKYHSRNWTINALIELEVVRGNICIFVNLFDPSNDILVHAGKSGLSVRYINFIRRSHKQKTLHVFAVVSDILWSHLAPRHRPVI